jgi:hypothetical protein
VIALAVIFVAVAVGVASFHTKPNVVEHPPVQQVEAYTIEEWKDIRRKEKAQSMTKDEKAFRNAVRSILSDLDHRATYSKQIQMNLKMEEYVKEIAKEIDRLPDIRHIDELWNIQGMMTTANGFLKNAADSFNIADSFSRLGDHPREEKEKEGAIEQLEQCLNAVAKCREWLKDL